MYNTTNKNLIYSFCQKSVIFKDRIKVEFGSPYRILFSELWCNNGSSKLKRPDVAIF